MIKRTLLPAVILIVAGCDLSDTRSRAPGDNSLVPLTVGNEWIWRTTEQRSHTGQTDESIRFDTTRVISKTSLQGESWYRLQEENGEFLATNRSSGYWHRIPPELGELDPLLVYKYPADIGDTFSRPSFPNGSLMRVESLDTTITVPAGTFQAVYYAQIWEDRPITCDFFVAPGIGLIKKVLPWVQEDTGDVVGVDTRELIEFTPG